jgi:hypothetical protein
MIARVDRERIDWFDPSSVESPLDVKGRFGVDGDIPRRDMKGSREMSRTNSYWAIVAITSTSRLQLGATFRQVGRGRTGYMMRL